MTHALDRTVTVSPVVGESLELTATFQGINIHKGRLFELKLPQRELTLGLLNLIAYYVPLTTGNNWDITINQEDDGLVLHWYEKDED